MAEEPTRNYTGPSGILRTENGLQIEGYPEAKRVALLTTPPARRLSVLRVHQANLDFCEAAMQQLLKVPSGLAQAKEAVVVGVVTKYFSCFGKNSINPPLQADRVFKGMDDAKDCFRYWKKIRDRHLVHEEGVLSERTTGIVLGNAESVIDVISMKATVAVGDQEHLQLLYDLIAHTRSHVMSEIDAVLQRIFAEANSMTPDERSKLEDLSQVIPSTKRLP